MAAIAQERLGGIDVLCANAGIFPDDAADITEETLYEVLGQLPTKGTVSLVQACLPRPGPVGPGPRRPDLLDHRSITGYPG